MSYKTWLRWLLILCFPLMLMALFNWFIDPLWAFPHSHKYNDVQESFNERQQKANKLRYDHKDYDSLLLGSSRSTYINHHEFNGYQVFNFAVSNMLPIDYAAFVDYANSVNNGGFSTIFIGVDFFATSVDMPFEDPLPYFRKAHDPIDRMKSLLSIDTTKLSIKNLRASMDNQHTFKRNYNRDNIAIPGPSLFDNAESAIQYTVGRYKKSVYGETYSFATEYKQWLINMKISNPDTRFIVFTTPISAPLFHAMIEQGLYPDYERWIKTLTSVFGEVYNFMYVNSVTLDPDNYSDGHHFLPHVGTLIAHRLTGVQEGGLPDDFGHKVNSSNIEEYLASFKKGIFQ